MPRVKLSDKERRERRRLAEQARRAAKRTSMTEDQRRERRRQAQRVRRADERAARASRITTEDQRREQRRQAQKARRAAQREARDSAILQERAQLMVEPPAAAVPFVSPSGNPLQGVDSNRHPPPASKRSRAVSTGQPHILQPCEARAVPSFALPLLPHPAAQQSPASQGCLHGASPHPMLALRPLLLSSVPRNMAAPEASISSTAAAAAVAKPGPPRQYTADELRERKNAAKRAKRKAAKSTIVIKSPNIQRAERAAAQRAGRRILPIRKREAEADLKPKLLNRQEASLFSAAATLEVAKYIEETGGEESICLLRFSKDFHFRCCSCAFVTSGRWSITTHLLAYAAGLGCQIWKETSNPTKTVENSWFSCCFCGHASGDQRAIIGHLIAHSADRLTILAPALRGPLFQGARLESAHHGS
ncbi:translation initiation factor IF-2 [Ixodes scapularis]